MVLGKRSSAVFARQEAADCTASRRRNSPAYWREIGFAAGQDVERVRRRQPRAQHRLVDPVAGDRVDEACGVADEREASTGGRRTGTPERKPVPADVGELPFGDPVLAAQPRKVGSKLRSLRVPPSHADVDVVGLGEDPAVAARNHAELDPRPAGEPFEVDCSVALERDGAKVVVEACLAPGRPVRAVGADHDLRFDRVVRPEAVAELRARLPRLLDQERVQPPPLGHPDQRFVCPAPEVPPVPEPQLEDVDGILDDRVDRERELAFSADGDPAAAGLVPREAGFVRQQHAGAAAREVKGGQRPGRPGSDDEGVHVFRRYYLRSPGGVPEWPKGTGCKPVGSAFGGSNPPAPTLRELPKSFPSLRAGSGK